MAKKYNYLCLWLFFFPAAHFYETFWPRKIWPPPTKKFGFRGQETVKTPPQIERGRRRPGKTAAKNTPDLGGAKVGLNDLF